MLNVSSEPVAVTRRTWLCRLMLGWWVKNAELAFCVLAMPTRSIGWLETTDAKDA